MSPKTDRHDIEVKLRSAERFLREGDRVKVNVRFRGREIVHADLVKRRLFEMAGFLSEVAVIERPPYLEGRQMSVMLGPKKVAANTADRSHVPQREVAVNAQGQDT